MSLLLLDIGNSALKWARAHGRQLLDGGRFVHRDTDLQAYADASWKPADRPASIVVANVAGPAIAASLSAWAKQQWGLEPRFLVSGRAAGGVTNGYAVPETLGIDRWAALVGARATTPDAACVVDCGTAITVDLLDTQGRHRGGLIVAGIDLMQQVLQRNTVNLLVPLAQTAAAPLADNTADAIVSGSVYAAAAAIERIVRDMAAAAGGSVEVLLTGGDAGRVAPLLTLRYEQHPDLVLRGLAILAGEN
jgi:type III pantothenate kinase